jgi:arylformamidase
MKIYDITRYVQEAPLYPGSPPVSVSPLSGFAQGDNCQTSLLVFDSHAGTHIDAPCHFIPGAPGIEGLDLYRGYGVCLLASVLPGAPVTAAALEGVLQPGIRLAIRGMGKSYLTVSAAHAIAKADIQAVVTDAVSVGPPDNEAEVHRILLGPACWWWKTPFLTACPTGSTPCAPFP